MTMRFVVYGAGAIGGVVGARMFENGHDVVLIARGAHYEAIRDKGSTVIVPSSAVETMGLGGMLAMTSMGKQP